MNERSLHVLEYGKIKERLAALCVSPAGHARALAMQPSGARDEAERLQQETEEARSVASELGGTPILYFADVTAPLRLAKMEGILSLRALLDIAGCLRAAKAARDAILTDREDTPCLHGIAGNLVSLHALERRITDTVLSEDEIADGASPELSSIRRRMRACNERVRDKLNGMIHSQTMQKYLQEAIITRRAERYVLPVRQEYRGMVPGIVHDQSASGATVFIEPMAVIEIGNELKQLIAAEKAEIDRILRQLSLEIAPEADGIAGNLEILALLDFIFARAALASDMRAVRPKLNDRGEMKIVRGRHPLIDPAAVVPMDLWMGKDFTTLIITGPNTGGKTVTLKTTGLFCLMAQSGLQVPAEYGTELAVFDEVFADIGDEQSIEQSLSTFSGHMKNIVGILREVTPQSLVLFDELGAGTDPTEGAALAQAILQRLLEKRTRTVATTHYSEMKEFALTTPGVENASVEFDVATLRPTYRLLIGIPGKSNAFEISRKLGLADGIIESARDLLSKEQRRFEDVLASAEYHRQVAEKERQMAEEAHREMLAIRDRADQEKRKLEEYETRTKQKAKQEARRIVEDARRESEALIAELRAMKKNAQIPEHEIQRAKRGLQDAEDRLRDEQDAAQGEPLKSVRVGDAVHVGSLDMDANVVSPPDAKGVVQLQSGALKLRAPLSDLYAPTAAQNQKRLQKEKIRNQGSGSKTRVDIAGRAVRREVDVRGLALSEAIPEIDKFLDDAVLSSLGEVSVIHGNGTGVLRSGIADHLKRHPAVKRFRLGVYGEGETGVTIVTLK